MIPTEAQVQFVPPLGAMSPSHARAGQNLELLLRSFARYFPMAVAAFLPGASESVCVSASRSIPEGSAVPSPPPSSQRPLRLGQLTVSADPQPLSTW